ncbi:MAG: hypothetical protein BroJett011_02180 [Chloroflexota bacterium]|nr:MAG: hypothetical protein BroJett011_02180 [Chloroflexota bacterium]
MAKKSKRVARLLGISEVEALDFCLQIQKYCKQTVPFDVIADFLEKNPKLSKVPAVIAQAIQKGTPEPKAPVGKPGSSARTHPEVVAPVNKSNSTSRATVEIIGPENDLGTFLKSIKKSKVDIAVAFATKTENLITTILNNGNKLALTVGTINHFTDPVFIKHCSELAKHNPLDFEFSVDFRGDDSIHWKLYLVEPDAIVIGSPNLTMTGLSMKRDTAVCFRDEKLYQDYLSLLYKLRQHESVIKSADYRFENFLTDYEKQHRKIIVRSLPDTQITPDYLSQGLPDFIDWLTQDKSQVLPIFIWMGEVPPEEVETFEKKIKPTMISDGDKTIIDSIYLMGVIEAEKNEQPYHNGEVLLIMKHSGAYIRFDKADVVIYGMGRWWLCGFANKKFDIPFTLTSELKSVIKNKCGSWLKANKTYLNSKDLRELSKLLKPK